MSMAVEIEEFIVEEIAAGRGIESLDARAPICSPSEVIDSLGIVELISFLEEQLRHQGRRRRPRRRELPLGRAASCSSSSGSGPRAMLMELLYDAGARPGREHTAIVYRRRAHRLRRAGGADRAPGQRTGPARDRRPATRSRWCCPTTPGSSSAFTRSRRWARSVVPVNPAFKQAELEFCFRSAGVAR